MENKVIVGNTVGVPNPKPDWNQTDERKSDFIKNKPTILSVKDVKKLIAENSAGSGGETSSNATSFIVNVEVAADGTVTPDKEVREIVDAYEDGKTVQAYVEYLPEVKEGDIIVSMGENVNILTLVNIDRIDATYKLRFANIDRLKNDSYQATYLWYEGAAYSYVTGETTEIWKIETVEIASSDYVDTQIGGIETALDSIIAIQNQLMGVSE